MGSWKPKPGVNDNFVSSKSSKEPHWLGDFAEFVKCHNPGPPGSGPARRLPKVSITTVLVRKQIIGFWWGVTLQLSNDYSFFSCWHGIGRQYILIISISLTKSDIKSTTGIQCITKYSIFSGDWPFVGFCTINDEMFWYVDMFLYLWFQLLFNPNARPWIFSTGKSKDHATSTVFHDEFSFEIIVIIIMDIVIHDIF